MNTNYPKLIILFGSRAKGNAREDSDIDVGVVTDKALELDEKLKLITDIAEKFKFNEDKLDVVDLNQASPLLQMEAAKAGKILEGSEPDFFKFKLLAWKRYQHTAKFRKMREDNFHKIYG